METNIVSPRLEFIKFIREQRETKEGKLDKKDKAYALMAEMEGWKELKAFILRRKESLLQMKEFNLEGATYEEMGQLFFLNKLVADELDKIIRKVEGAREVVKDNTRAQ